MPSPLRVAGAVTAAILCLPCTAVSAVGWETAVAVPMTVEHDTNPQLDSLNKRAVTRTIVAPDYNLVGVSDSDQWQFGFGLHLERSILELVQEQAHRLQTMGDELDTVRASLNERKLIERAKGLLMAHRHLSEEEAHKTMRQMAMNQNRRLIEVAEAVLAMADVLPVRGR
mgnify:CR=1 FL=1